MPAGPRKSGEGVEDEEQGIVSAESTPAGCVMACHGCLPVCPNFVLGPMPTGCFNSTLVVCTGLSAICARLTALMQWWVWLPYASTGLCAPEWHTSLKSVVGHVQVSPAVKTKTRNLTAGEPLCASPCWLQAS